jgi:hypothetical protein
MVFLCLLLLFLQLLLGLLLLHLLQIFGWCLP